MAAENARIQSTPISVWLRGLNCCSVSAIFFFTHFFFFWEIGGYGFFRDLCKCITRVKRSVDGICICGRMKRANVLDFEHQWD
jgi:hypothetical protein